MSLWRRREAYKWQQSGSAPAVETLQATFNSGSSFFESDRAAREGNIGPTMVPTIVAIPSSGVVGNQQFRFRQLDAAGVPIGPNVSSLFPALAGYADNVVDLPTGILTAADVAAGFEAVAGGVYASSSVVSNVVTITDDIDAASAFLPSNTSGGGGIMGTRDILGPNDFAQPDSNVCTFVTPAFASTAYLWAAQIKIGGVYSDRLRLAAYLGGGINAPVGTPLLYDFGLTPAGAATNQYATLYCNSLVPVPASSRLQILLVGATGTSTEVNYQNAAGSGDYNVSPGGIWQVNGGIGTDPTVAPPAVFPAGGSNTTSNFTFNVRLIYRLGSLRTDGQLNTQYGVHVDTSALTSRSNYTGNVFTGGNLPPQIEGLNLDYASIAAETDASFRLDVYQGGVLEQPDASTLVRDFGRGPGGPGLPTDWYRLDVPAGTVVPIDRTQRIWMVGRNAGAGDIAFALRNVNPGPGPAGPETNPMDWPQNLSNPLAGDRPEYETLNTNPNFSVDPDDAFEATFQSDATDFRPGNIPGMRLGFRTRPVELVSI